MIQVPDLTDPGYIPSKDLPYGSQKAIYSAQERAVDTRVEKLREQIDEVLMVIGDEPHPREEGATLARARSPPPVEGDNPDGRERMNRASITA